MWNGVKRPALAPGVDVERADVAGRRWQRLGHDRSDDQEIAVEHARRVHADAERARVTALESLAQIDPAALAEPGQRLTGLRIERVQPVPRREIDAPVVAALPVHQPADPRACERLGVAVGVEAPDLGAGGRVQRKYAKLRRGRIQHAVRDDRLALHFRSVEGIVRVVGPRHPQRADVGARDLLQPRVSGLLRVAAVVQPVARLVDGRQRREEQEDHEDEMEAHGDGFLYRPPA